MRRFPPHAPTCGVGENKLQKERILSPYLVGGMDPMGILEVMFVLLAAASDAVAGRRPTRWVSGTARVTNE